VEFAAKNHTSKMTYYTSDFGYYSIQLRITFAQHPSIYPNDIHKVKTQRMAQWMVQLFNKLEKEMKRAQTVQTAEENQFQRVGISLEVTTIVWLDAGNISTTQPNRQLNYQCIGSYEVTKIINPCAYWINLPTCYTFTMFNRYLN
jgi:hypothetical protein